MVASTIDRSVPAAGSPRSSAALRAQFARAANDIETLLSTGAATPTGTFRANDGAHIVRLNDRLFVGSATENDGRKPNITKDWLTNEINWPVYNATSAFLSPNGRIAITAGSQTLDLDSIEAGTTQTTIGVAAFALANNPGTYPVDFFSAYAFYGEGRVDPGTVSNAFAAELEAINLTGAAIGPSTPYRNLSLAATHALRLGSGGGQGLSPFDAQAAISIVNNQAKFETGIVFAKDALTGATGTSGFGTAMALGLGHMLTWWRDNGGIGEQTTFITSTATAPVASLQFQNGGTVLVTPGGKLALNVGNVANAVNGISILPAAVGTAPSITTIGDDANPDLIIKPKGAGNLQLWADQLIFYSDAGNQMSGLINSVTNTTNLNTLQFADTGPFLYGRGAVIMGFQQNTSAVNYIEARNAISGAAVGMYALGSNSNIPFVVQPKGTGPFQLQLADALASGGNTRGANAVDLQTARSFAASVASGANSIVLGGSDNRATAANSMAGGTGAQATNTGALAIGNSAIASGVQSIALGDGSTATNSRSAAIGSGSASTGARGMALGYQSNDRGRTGALVHASGGVAASGDKQTLVATNLHGTTTDAATAVRLTSDGAAAGALNSMPLANAESMRFRIMLVAQVSGVSSKEWMIEGLIRRGANAASTAMVGAATITSAFGDAGLSTCTVACTADTTNGGLNLTVNGVAATTIAWNAWVSGAELVS